MTIVLYCYCIDSRSDWSCGKAKRRSVTSYLWITAIFREEKAASPNVAQGWRLESTSWPVSPVATAIILGPHRPHQAIESFTQRSELPTYDKNADPVLGHINILQTMTLPWRLTDGGTHKRSPWSGFMSPSLRHVWTCSFFLAKDRGDPQIRSYRAPLGLSVASILSWIDARAIENDSQPIKVYNKLLNTVY